MKKQPHLTYSTTILHGIRRLDGTAATGLARTFRLGLNRTVRDKKMGKKIAGDEIGCFLNTRATARDKKMGKAILQHDTACLLHTHTTVRCKQMGNIALPLRTRLAQGHPVQR